MSDPTLQALEKALGLAAQQGNVKAAQAITAEMRRMLIAANPDVTKPEDPRIAASKMAAKGMGGMEAATISAGRTADKILSGVKQVQLQGLAGGEAPGIFKGLTPQELQPEGAKAELDRMAVEQTDKDIAFSGVQRERPISSALGGMAPYLGVPGSAGILAGAGMAGGMEAMQYGTPEERASRGLLGTATFGAGGMLGKAVGRAIAPVAPRAISGTQSAALRSGQNLGIKPRLSEVTGSRFLARMEDMAARTPGGAGIMDDFARGNTQSINRAASQTIGENADELTPSVFAAASDRLGKVFESVKKLPGQPIRITANVGNAADDILRQQSKMIPQQQDANLIKLAREAKWAAQNKGRIDGETYQLLRSGLSEASFDASGTNRALYGKLLESVDDAAEESLKASGHGELASSLRTARAQYSNLKTLERGLVAEGGNVSPARLGGVLRSKNPGAFREGRGGVLGDIARYGESFKPLQQGSQTYERQAASDLLGLLVQSPVAYGTAKFTTSPLMTAYPGLLARNPRAAMFANQAGLLASPAARGASMGLLNDYLQ